MQSIDRNPRGLPLGSCWQALALAIVVWMPMASLAQDQEAKDKAEVAREAYDPADSKPVESWFGCPPQDEDTGQDAEQASKEHAGQGQDDSEQDRNCGGDPSGKDAPEDDKK